MMSNTKATTDVAILTSATINKKSKQLNKESMAWKYIYSRREIVETEFKEQNSTTN